MDNFSTEIKYRIEDVNKNEFYGGFFYELEVLKRLLNKLREHSPNNKYVAWKITTTSYCDKIDL